MRNVAAGTVSDICSKSQFLVYYMNIMALHDMLFMLQMIQLIIAKRPTFPTKGIA
jgi:hypothetical protein